MNGAPPDDAYERVTNPERFGPIHGAADALIARLLATYQVDCRQAAEAPSDGVIRQIELVPLLGAPLAVRWTDFPGLAVRFGRWHEEHYPSCGCDACAEDADDLIADLERSVEAVVAGQFTEAVVTERDGTWLTFELRHRHGRRSGRCRLGAGDPRLAETGEIIWPAWPLRRPEVQAGA